MREPSGFAKQRPAYCLTEYHRAQLSKITRENSFTDFRDIPRRAFAQPVPATSDRWADLGPIEFESISNNENIRSDFD